MMTVNCFKKKTIAVLVVLLFSYQLAYADYDSFTVNVPNAQGGYTSISIKKHENGYLGPQGEYYSEFPSVVQLQAVYGLNTSNAAIVTNTYVQPQAQPVVNTQVVYQIPIVDREDNAGDYPINRPYLNEAPRDSHPSEEDNSLIMFGLKKKKKSKASPVENTKTTQSAPIAQEHQAPPVQQAKTVSNSSQGKSALPKVQDSSVKDKSASQNKPKAAS